MKLGRLMLVGIFVCGAAAADEYHDQMERLKVLDKRCEQARAAKLGPIRATLVKECVGDQRRSLQDCQGEYSTHGESITGVRGNVIRGLFYDLPECKEAEQAWKAWEAKQPLHR